MARVNKTSRLGPRVMQKRLSAVVEQAGNIGITAKTTNGGQADGASA